MLDGPEAAPGMARKHGRADRHALTGNGIGTAGVGRNVRVLPVRVLPRQVRRL